MILYNAFLRSYSVLKPTGNKFELNGTANNLNVLSVPFFGLYGPTSWYDNGRTYLAHRKSHVNSDGRAGIIQYYNGAVTNQFMASVPGSLDYHDNPTVITDGAGTIYLMNEQHQLDYKAELWKTSTPYDITSFVKQADTPVIGEYPKFYRVSSNSFFVIGRIKIDITHWDLYLTTFDGLTWGTPIKFAEAQLEEGGSILYPYYQVNGNDDDGWMRLRWSKKLNYTAEEIYYKNHYQGKCRTSDLFTWYNEAETFSKDVSVAHLTEAEMDTNFKYAENSALGFSGGGAAYINQGQVQQINIINNVWTLFTTNGATISSSVVSDLNQTRLLINGSYKGSFGHDSNNLFLYNTSDYETFNIKNLLYTSTDGLWTVIMPYNYNEIPRGQRFAVFAGGQKNGDTDVVNSTEENNIYIVEMIK